MSTILGMLMTQYLQIHLNYLEISIRLQVS